MPAGLIQAHIAHASILIIAVSGAYDVRPLIECARKLNANIEIVIRTHNEDEATLLKGQGPGKVFFAEEEIAKNISDYVLDRFGKT
jgi:CPA2 family monovalent cation:H+ antiporter-2